MPSSSRRSASGDLFSGKNLSLPATSHPPGDVVSSTKSVFACSMKGDFFSMRGLAGLLGALMLCSCASEEISYTPGAYAQPSQADLFDWQGYGLTGPVKIVINLTTQRADIYIGGSMPDGLLLPRARPDSVRLPVTTPSSKRSLTSTPPSTARSSTPTAIPSNPTPMCAGSSSSGRPVCLCPYAELDASDMDRDRHACRSHSAAGDTCISCCIRLPDEMAAALFERVQIGTPVEIVR